MLRSAGVLSAAGEGESAARYSATVDEVKLAGIENAEKADLNSDGIVDMKDVKIFVQSTMHRGR